MHLTVIPGDKQIYLETAEVLWPYRMCHVVNESSFWNSIDQRIHAIQYHSDGLKQIEYKNPRENIFITDESILNIYIIKFNERETAYQALLVSQKEWDSNNVQNETLQEKINRIGPRPNTY